jgi:hypothetical protein
MTLEQHPLSAAFPAMSEDDFQALVDDIEVNGQREPIIIFDGMVLDGWHRYQACLRTATPPTKFNFKSDEDPVAFVKSQNLHRRHLTASQRAAAVVACSEWHPAHRQKKVAVAATLPKTNGQMAKEAGVKVRTITDVKTAKNAGLIEPVRDGALTAEEAGKIVRGHFEKKQAPKPEDDQDAVAILSEENDRLNARLAVAAMDGTPEEKALAADTIESLQAQVKTMTAELDAVKASRDSYMRELAEVKRQCLSQQRQLKKLRGAND